MAHYSTVTWMDLFQQFNFISVKAEKDIVAQNSFTNKAESKISLVNETKEKLPEGISPLKINPHSTKV